MMFRENNNRIHKITAAILLTAILLSSCGTDNANACETKEGMPDDLLPSVSAENAEDAEIGPAAEYSEFDLNTEIAEDAERITLNGGTADFTGEDIELRDGKLVISAGGDYILTGRFDGQIIVNAGADDNVHLILDGADLSAVMTPLYFVNARNASITLADGSVNRVSDTADYTYAEGEDEPNAAIFSKCDLTINGSGSLAVNGLHECGIRSKDDLKIVNGDISVQSVGDAIKGKDSLVIRDGNITVVSGADGLKANNDEDENRGYVIIEGGTINITAGDDAVHAETWLQVYDGCINVHESYEALEGKKIEIYGGTLDLLASDDGINASSGNSSADRMGMDDMRGNDRGDMKNDRGAFWGGDNREGMEQPEMPSDAMRPEMPAGGEIPEMPSEAMTPEMPSEAMTPEMPSDTMIPEMPADGEMPAGGEKPAVGRNDARGENPMDQGQHGGGKNFGGMGGMNEAAEDGVYIRISGGTIRVQGGVDVIDSNGTFIQTGGTLVTVGTSMQICGMPDCVIDTNGDALVESGTFVSLARSGGNGLEDFTALPGFLYSTGTVSDASNELTVADGEGKVVVSFIPGVSCQTIFVTSEKFEKGKEYTVCYGDKETIYSCTESVVSLK